jgi:hypothetical protein
MPILNGSCTYIRFLHGKMGRKISRNNAAMYPLYKSLIGIYILEEQMCFTITQAYLLLLRT